MIDVTGPCEFKVGLGRRFRSDELKSSVILIYELPELPTLTPEEVIMLAAVSLCPL